MCPVLLREDKPTNQYTEYGPFTPSVDNTTNKYSKYGPAILNDDISANQQPEYGPLAQFTIIS